MYTVTLPKALTPPLHGRFKLGLVSEGPAPECLLMPLRAPLPFGLLPARSSKVRGTYGGPATRIVAWWGLRLHYIGVPLFGESINDFNLRNVQTRGRA